MKKRTISALLGLAGAALLTTGAFASDVDEILANFTEASAQVTELACDADMNADISINLPDLDTSFGISGSGQLRVEAAMDPLAVKVNGTMTGDAMGQGGTVDMELYMVTKEDGSFGMYTNATMGEEATGWTYQEIPAEVTAQMLEMMKDPSMSLANFPISFELADGTVDVNGASCYQLSTVLTWTELRAITEEVLAKMAEQSEEEISMDEMTEAFDMIGTFASGIQFNLEIDVDTETYLPLKAHIDAEGSDWTILGALFAQYAGMTNEDGSLMNVDIAVNSLYIDYLYDYDTAVDITVPDEAVAAEANGSALDGDAAQDLLGSIAG